MKLYFNNTSKGFDKLVSKCKRDENFNEAYTRIGSYLEAIYLYDAVSNSDYTEQFDIIDTNLYQAADNDAICLNI